MYSGNWYHILSSRLLSMPGGRPKTDWKPSRTRRLARLYILSNLNLNEIQILLKENGFDPRQDSHCVICMTSYLTH